MAKTYVEFVNEVTLKTLTSLHDNVNMQDVRPQMFTAQDLYLEPMLGTHFYDVLQFQIAAYGSSGQGGTAAFSPYYQEFINNYCVPLVMWGTLYKAIPWIAIKLNNMGVGAQNPQYEVNSDGRSNLRLLQEEAKTNLENYKESLRRELIIHQWKYPSFISGVPQNKYPQRQIASPRGIMLPSWASATMNQNYGAPLEAQGGGYYSSGYGYQWYGLNQPGSAA